jgi:prepilin-type N-terminal cleavage/methylation domain-containing protein
MKRRGFTLVELLVVLTMIMILVGAMTASVNAARRRARMSKAQQEMKELTNAILAFEQYAPGRTLSGFETGGWKACTEQSIAMVLGGVAGEGGEKVPVLYAASLTGGNMLDPWGKPYEFIIEKTATLGSGDGTAGSGASYKTAAQLPNFFRLQPAERAIPKRN